MLAFLADMIGGTSQWPLEVAIDCPDLPSGIVAVGGKLNPETLLAAYTRGVFPWPCGEKELLWWSPDPRLVLRPKRLRVSRSLRATLRKRAWVYTLNSRFREVMSACADSGEKRETTWITQDMRAAFADLHDLDFAHSLEVSDEAGNLLGGLYGVGVGRMFFGESMFALVADASKAALYQLCQHLSRRGLQIIDCQVETQHLLSLGAELMKREAFCEETRRLCCLASPQGLWSRQKLNYHAQLAR